jgi:hypothetical protein
MGVMIRFTAEPCEIERMLRYLTRRMPGGMRLVPLEGKDRHDLRFRHTPRPLLTRLETDDRPTAWGLRAGAYDAAPLVRQGKRAGPLCVEAEASHLIVLDLGPAQGAARQREGLLFVRDWPEPPDEDGSADSDLTFSKHLLERCARSIRRRGRFEDGRWYLPDCPKDDPRSA